jgi:hypothetical protein
VAIAQPSAEFDAYAVTMPSGHGSPLSLVSNEPSSRATCGLPARPSTRFSSMSGLMPQSTRRKIFRIASSSKTTLVLLCSASNTRGAESTGSVTSGSGWNVIGPTVSPEEISVSRNCVADGS